MSQQLHYVLLFIFIRSWRNNIWSKVSTPNQLEVYQTLCIMESEIDEAIFTTLIKSLITQWEKRDSKFVAYFQEYYCNRTGMYSLCVMLNHKHTHPSNCARKVKFHMDYSCLPIHINTHMHATPRLHTHYTHAYTHTHIHTQTHTTLHSHAPHTHTTLYLCNIHIDRHCRSYYYFVCYECLYCNFLQRSGQSVTVNLHMPIQILTCTWRGMV